ncbi:glyoxalase/bleomycin resistance/extradiol dioxygenase family protein [Listeria monocytogenes]|uniref:VOC family protein n=1 Tax=Listeria monocytogenes TaxID=1639 RepID=UPI0011EB783B|nr:VOC family protein [Listeria monocytogenes]EAE7279555.1 glyoxalase/bleomycin resistance/extradiol dioxygenase family protein [Listeria monocytogenes]ECC0873205.1 glyoxalase/bleomycin resistance/extradiol dioxygenase family protein [Listeria monocytogenes]ECC0879380.1 glyoxalase/bleomycin resistance/extradiol dioxygenase family protein [Listeria monocytogenes]ECC0891996.1 glyoxalase/bleomycin resistance/extradiol dioxygenase family protein [Listeria monocytogenes]ECC0894700.1 glyoxalase/bleo
MKIEHVALWTTNLEQMKQFYVTYFGVTANDLYENKTKGFTSYFLSFEDGARLEIMSRTDVTGKTTGENLGWAHIAISTGTKEAVDELTEKLRQDGFAIAGEPRMTGDGYYESVVLDPEGNRIEITW